MMTDEIRTVMKERGVINLLSLLNAAKGRESSLNAWLKLKTNGRS